MRRRGGALAVLGALLGVVVATAVAAAADPPPAAAAPAARPCSVMLDLSMSMTGFPAGGADPYRQLVETLSRRCSEPMVVGDGADFWRPDRGPLADARPTKPFGRKTRLDQGLAFWLKSSTRDRLVILTDNIADAGDDAAAAEQDRFYRLLDDPASQLSHISVIIFRRPFAGPVYGLGKPAPKGFYTGDRALTLYVLERRGGRTDEAFLNDVRGDLLALGLKLFNGAAKPDSATFAIARLSPFLPDAVTNDNVQVQPLDGGKGVSIDGKTIIVKRGVSDQATRFAVSKMTVDTGPNWDFGGAPFEAYLKFPKHPLFGAPIRSDCSVEPKALKPGLGQKAVISIICPVPAVWNSLTPEQQLALAKKSKAWRSGELVLAIKAKKGDLTLRGPLQQFYGMNPQDEADRMALASDRAEVHERVYRLPQLLENMIPTADHTVVIKTVPLKLQQGQSPLPVLELLFKAGWPVALLLALLGPAVWFLSRPASFQATGATDKAPFTLGFMSSRTLTAASSITPPMKATVTFWGLLMTASMGGGMQLLGPGGGSIRGPARTSKPGAPVFTIKRIAKAGGNNGSGRPKPGQHRRRGRSRR
ncbi:hypothetical protein QO010_003525 [Caulobacter ginsengisoli]|uniref:Aerotolerance regulator N-terminal domain-containing protein n=1 Tax=Caulobacter ginsengisoli TaxID=400775 RepID=A0ABU0IX16_9CAUL|nr:hypothetical protein [Caulobacter ginsengisoli]MDQ0465733.1 hypothetical protein [Caulobacter ginsengisoli]